MQTPPQPPPAEKLSSANITDIMQTACIDYSMSVIVSCALPCARSPDA
jgi:DNA gyrase subunit A